MLNITKKISTTLILPIRLVTSLCQRYSTTNASLAIRYGLADFLMLPSLPEMSNFASHQLFTVEERRNTYGYRVKLPQGLLETLSVMYPKYKLKDIATMMLATVLYTPPENANYSEVDMHLVRIMGSKWDKRMQSGIDHILNTCNCNWNISIETCVGALGIYSNFKFADSEVINDDDWNKINLYKAIQNHPKELVLELYSFECTHITFNYLKELKPTPTKKIDIAAAARYLFLNLCSYRNMGGTFNTKLIATTNLYYKKLNAIYPLHLRLQNALICETDIFKIISKHRKELNAIFIIDPNYLNANAYQERMIRNPEKYGKAFGLAEHTKLAQLLRRIKEADHNDFIYFCRITATRKKDKNNQAVSTPEELKLADRDLHETINDLYYGFGFYFCDIELDNGTTERIITSFPFQGATPYGKEVL